MWASLSIFFHIFLLLLLTLFFDTLNSVVQIASIKPSIACIQEYHRISIVLDQIMIMRSQPHKLILNLIMYIYIHNMYTY